MAFFITLPAEYFIFDQTIPVEISELYQLYLQSPSIQTDTRKLHPGDIYWALKGPNFNGNLFAEKALEMGAAYAIVDEPVAPLVATHEATNETEASPTDHSS